MPESTSTCLICWEPALALAANLTVIRQSGQNAVQIIGFDLHLLGDLGDGYPGPTAH
jgi:hypothetical protein